jgi:hypothetical protein
MTSKAQKLAARAAASSRGGDQDAPPFARDDATPAAPEQRRDEPSATVNTRKVRTTVVLDNDEYEGLADYCRAVERRTGRRGVAGSEVVRVLLGLLRHDDALAERVRAEIEQNGGNRRR